MAMMKAAVFIEPGRIELVDKKIPDVGPDDVLMRITTTTICGTDVHILKGEYPVAKKPMTFAYPPSHHSNPHPAHPIQNSGPECGHAAGFH